ncbi:MAG: hypothetical protein ACJZ4O_00365 [Pelagibacteraceae bacterium]
MIQTIEEPLNSNKLIGLVNHFEYLYKLFINKSFPNAMLISGDKGIGKFTLINHFLNYVFDKKNYNLNEKIIDLNSNIYKRILSNNFENIIYLKNTIDKKIKIDDVRNLKKILSMSSFDKNQRFIIIDDVELLNINALNALLKLIEEPTQNNYFILINNQQNNLLETVSSRCFINKIFIKELDRLYIINELINYHKIEKVLNFNSSKISPGKYLIFNSLCLEHKINPNQNYIENINKLLLLYKKKKDKRFFDLSIFFTEQFFYTLYLKKIAPINLINQNKINTIKELNDYVNYNLNLNILLNSIENKINYE